MSDPEGYRFLPHAKDVCMCEGCLRARQPQPPAPAPADTPEAHRD